MPNPAPNGPADGAGTDPNNAPNAGGPTGGAPANGPADNAGQQQPKPGDGDDLANLSQADLAKMVKDLRKEAGAARTTAKATAAQKARDDLAQEIGRAIGLVKDDGEKADPAKLAEQLQGERRERFAEKAARKAKLDPDTFLDSREVAGKLRKLDPTSDTFDSDLESLVTGYADDPRFKTTSAGQAPARSGGDFSGGPGNATTFTREQIARMTPAEYAKNREAIMAQLSKSK